ncbi:excinuclease ABC subunit C [Candidatus Endobugula sertula]|uniref:UvrABC system protein C n=1 Tax=Candidatus Endobugula sertula TaxID=62101 RepID=A0A1D2QR58_9GAMM|nr:excinuclease ABC subunit C [Candidatus Endobugula sertula]
MTDSLLYSHQSDEKKPAFDALQFLKTVTAQPGVYQMFNADEKILYVGKAKNLKKRLTSYFRKVGLTIKTKTLVEKIATIQVTVTKSEMEALVLEQNLIKSLRPTYNILLKDGKSYPYIFISDETYPRIGFHRGMKNKPGEYYGPFPNAGGVYQSLNFIQKTFRVRQCEDSVFKNRSRPCLQYQINRCTAPCVNLISADAYQQDMLHAALFLKGESTQLMQHLADKMEKSSEALEFEQAGIYRDQISALRKIQAGYGMEAGKGKIDIFAFIKKETLTCIHILYIRHGRILGSKSFFPKNKLALSNSEFLTSFLEQFYIAHQHRELPQEILVNVPIKDSEQQLLVDVLQQRQGGKVTIAHRVRAQRHKWLSTAVTAAEQNLIVHIHSKQNLQLKFSALQNIMELDELPQRLECFDISHTSGELTVASCVVFDQSGPLKSDYRRFNIEGITEGDDYAAMEQALSRRYTRLQKGESQLPDILVIDGGKGQLNVAKAVLSELGVNQVVMLGIAKGVTRKAGFETLVLEAGQEKVLNVDSPALHLLQEIRDEAHRFAITGHKQRRNKKRKTSSLEGIVGVGAKRRRELLRYFGGMQEVQAASIDELSKVNGISKKIAKDIYSALHNE